MKPVERLNRIGITFLGVLDSNIGTENLTQDQVSLILSLQKGLEERNGQWYHTHFPHNQFSTPVKPTTSKLVIGKIRKRFLKLS